MWLSQIKTKLIIIDIDQNYNKKKVEKACDNRHDFDKSLQDVVVARTRCGW